MLNKLEKCVFKSHAKAAVLTKGSCMMQLYCQSSEMWCQWPRVPDSHTHKANTGSQLV